MSKGRTLAVSLAALVVAGIAVSPTFGLPGARGGSAAPAALIESTDLGSFTPAGVDMRLAGQFASGSRRDDDGFQFTPAGVDRGNNRAMTIIVRSRAPATAGAVSVRNALAAAGSAGKGSDLTPTSYRLGSARGLQSFTLPVKTRSASAPLVESLGKGFQLDEAKPVRPSRFNPRISVDKASTVATSPRPLDGQRDYALDLGGSYSITRSVDVTAGVRYKSENDLMDQRLTDDRNDSQAVYVGTLIRF